MIMQILAAEWDFLHAIKVKVSEEVINMKKSALTYRKSKENMELQVLVLLY